jgi:hypothetical protein
VSRELQPWPSNFQKPSELYKTVVFNSQHPPLMQPKSWNLAIPYKEQKHFHSPSESIANNFSPYASDLKIRRLTKKTNKNAQESISLHKSFKKKSKKNSTRLSIKLNELEEEVR